MEKTNIANFRCPYLCEIKQYREKEMDIVYLDEIWVDSRIRSSTVGKIIDV